MSTAVAKLVFFPVAGVFGMDANGWPGTWVKPGWNTSSARTVLYGWKMFTKLRFWRINNFRRHGPRFWRNGYNRFICGFDIA